VLCPHVVCKRDWSKGDGKGNAVRRPAGKRKAVEYRLDVPPSLSVLAGVRRQLRGFLAAHDVPESAASDLVLCTQEALKNAVRFARTEISVSVEINPTFVTCLVRDRGPGLPMTARRLVPPIGPDPLEVSGRGFLIMTSLMDDLHVDSDGGLEVRMRKRLSPLGD
jgi:anti-sigma regulatory factor (Ser/Thr protein kinase)